MRDGDGYGWTVDHHAGKLFEGNKELSLLKGLGKTMETKLEDRGFTSLHLLFQAISDSQCCNEFVSVVRGLRKKKTN